MYVFRLSSLCEQDHRHLACLNETFQATNPVVNYNKFYKILCILGDSLKSSIVTNDCATLYVASKVALLYLIIFLSAGFKNNIISRKT